MSATASLTPEQRKLRAQIAANVRWKNTNRKQASEDARRRIFERFEREIPEEVTDPRERSLRAENALKAHMASLAFKSSRARQSRRAA